MTATPEQPSVEFVFSPVVNFAMQQNHVPVIRKLTIRNNTVHALQYLTITLTAEPEFAAKWTRNVDEVAADAQVELAPANVRLSGQYLASLTERIAGTFTLSITSGDTLLLNETYDVGILAYDQWNGTAVLPEMLSAFITPNHPDLPKLLKRASAILEKWTGNPNFDAYQTQSADRVLKQMAAIYEAITELDITYCTVPASFEASGQRVRMADTLLAQRMANCLDLSLLYAACLEAAGLHALVVIIKGHAFVGGWLVEDSFADSVNDDVSLLTKRIADGINEIVVLEATCMNAGQRATFDQAVMAARQHLLKEADFELFVDVKRSRFSGIRPLPLQVQTATGWEIAAEAVTERNTAAPEDIVAGPRLTYASKTAVSKQNIWERKLLDLSLRNNLLNLRMTKTVIQLIAVNPGALEDALSDGGEFLLLPKPADWDNPLRSAGLYQGVNQSDPVVDLVQHEFSQKRLRTYTPELELPGIMTNLYRAAKLSLEENGANTLYIALGVLKWYETNLSERPRFAPILLLPVEIVRKSAQKGYVIRGREEETMMNITLLEMMRQDFGIDLRGMETLPKDDSGVDVKAILNLLRQAIMNQKRWDVEEQTFLGTFSFNKFIMWNDIHNNAEKLKQNKIVSSLMAGQMQWDTPRTETSGSLDKMLHPSEIALPISTDSSQLEAIAEAAKDESFILHGPPGTGKSQTITNIIANALYRGKKVLFVAEKMAALQVVQSRLEAIGLAPFCLELHSNKSKKTAVLDQLRKTSEVVKKASPEAFTLEAERLHTLRAELNSYVAALHKPYPFGFSLYEAFTRYAEVGSVKGKVVFSDKDIAALSPAQISVWNDMAHELETAGKIIGHPYDHPLQEVSVQYTPALKTAAKETLDGYVQSLEELRTLTAQVTGLLKIDIPVTSHEHRQVVKMLATLLLQLPDTPPSMLRVENMEQTFAQLEQVAEHGKRRDALKNALTTSYAAGILSFEARRMLKEWNEAANLWFLPRWLKQRAIKKTIDQQKLEGHIGNEQVPALLQDILNYQQKQEVIADNRTFLAGLLGYLWQQDTCDWQKLESMAAILVQLNRQAIMLFAGGAGARQWRTALSVASAEGTKDFVTIHEHKLERYIQRCNKVLQYENEIQKLLGVDFSAAREDDKDKLGVCATMAQKWLGNLESLRDWSNWNAVKKRCMTGGLSPLIRAYEAGEVESRDVVNSFKKGLYRACVDFIFGREPILASFSGQQFEARVARFREVSATFEKLTREELYAKLASRIPSFTQEASQTSEISILQRAIRANARGVTIRKLFDSIPNLLPRMHPCMLMSPISVAQYFDAGTTRFDLVVFDEASQMPTCEAVGAIARGANVVIVGDPKQMPPTSFFSTNQVDEDNLDKEDMESILDDCLTLSMPSKHLLWHYRSKHESLIAFSNSRFYENKLLTFPSPDDIATRVSFEHVPGFYDRGKSKQNRAEAQAIVNEILRRAASPSLSGFSIGVVTFSSVQQTLIEDMLNEVLKTRPEVEVLLMQRSEPLFIKNLENVQGDERDVILFSVGYGPDQEGKVSLNFGPINRNGGWRRLNVAVSRARQEMKVFSTLKADQIDIARTSSEGVASLRAFLEYAEKGRCVLPQTGKTASASGESVIRIVADEIRKHNYEVHTHIGCSGYKIDIGIVDPDSAGEYLLGVLCDGYNYSAAKTSRDREIVQTDVLQSLGWTIHRIWSIEWWENPARQLEGVLEALTTAVAQKKSSRIAAAEGPVTIEKIPIENTVLNQLVRLDEAKQPAPIAQLEQYVVTDLGTVNTRSSDDFLLTANRQKICDQITRVIALEAPVSRNLLCKRVLAAWGISRLGTRLSNHFDSLFPVIPMKQTGTSNAVFYWRIDQKPADYTSFRIPGEGEKRDADDIAPEETANAVKYIVTNQVSLAKDELIKETARLFGFSRLGINVDQSMAKGVAHALQKHLIKEVDGRIMLSE